MSIPFVDLAAQRARLGDRIEQAIGRVLDHGKYIFGPEVDELEARLRDFCGARHAITCANGTDALTLALMAEGIGPGDAVFVPSFTFVATAEAPAQLGATPVMVDVREDSFNIDPQSLERAVSDVGRHGLKPRAVIAVDLFGQPADYAALGPIARRDGMVLIADAAQSFGGVLDGRGVGCLADYTTTSFFPAKPLGCYGDGGAVFTDDDEAARRLLSIRLHGKGTDKYDNVRIGLNSRLDTIQAAILIEKLTIFADEIAARNRVAERYADALSNVVAVPRLAAGATSVWAQYTVRIPDGRRDAVAESLRKHDVPSAVYYPIPLHRQSAYAHYPVAPDGAPVSERLAGDVLSLPMHPYLDAETQARIAGHVADAVARQAGSPT